MKRLAFSTLLLALMWGAGNASAAILLDNSGVPSVQQTLDNPCLLGGPDCGSSQPVGWTFTDVNPNDNDGVITGTEGYSPEYDYDLFHSVSGDTFYVGIDTNQAGNQTDPANRLVLDSAGLYVNTGGGFILVDQFVGPASINLNNGTGFSDAILGIWDISGYGSGDLFQFRVVYHNATDGADSFFMIPTTQIPEPETYAMLLAGLGLLGWTVRRKRMSQAL